VEALVLLAESDIDSVYTFLFSNLKGVNHRLYNEILSLKGSQNLIIDHKEKGLITTEEFVVYQNRKMHGLKIIVENLDKPFEDTYVKSIEFDRIFNPSKSSDSSNEGFLLVIFFVQVLILIGIGILIYQNSAS